MLILLKALLMPVSGFGLLPEDKGMLKRLSYGCLGVVFLMSVSAQAEMNVSSTDTTTGQRSSVSASIRIVVHIPVQATLKLNADAKQISSETNLQNKQSLILSCNNPQGLPVANCSTQQSGQVYTLTTL